jgi:hypothetical protein
MGALGARQGAVALDLSHAAAIASLDDPAAHWAVVTIEVVGVVRVVVAVAVVVVVLLLVTALTRACQCCLCVCVGAGSGGIGMPSDHRRGENGMESGGWWGREIGDGDGDGDGDGGGMG